MVRFPMVKHVLSALSILVLINIVAFKPTFAEEVLGQCQEVDIDSEDYSLYASESNKFHSIPPLKKKFTGDPVWRAASVKGVNRMVLTINSVSPSQYGVHMDTSDHSNTNLDHQMVIKMSFPMSVTPRYFQMIDFATCRIPYDQAVPVWAYQIEPFTYARRR